MLPSTITVPPSAETLAYLSAVASDEATYQAAVLKAREYHDGQQFVVLTDRLRMFLGGEADTSADYDRLRLNVCRVVVQAVVERLMVSGFDTDETPVSVVQPDGTTRTIKPVADWAWRTWVRNRMDAKQRAVHLEALRDSEAFVLVDWDAPNGRARFTPHQRYVDGSEGGDGQGCRAFYRNDDPDQDLLFVTKQWSEVIYPNGLRTARRRLTVYHPDRIEKYSGWPGAWRPTVDADSEPWPIPWRGKDGRPLGIPVAHFRSSAGMEAREAWPLQNAINKLLVDFMTESDMSAFRIMLAFGWEPVDSDGAPLTITPGTWIGSTNPDAKAQVIPAGELAQFLDGIDSLVFKVATVTDTPITRFVVSKQVASEGTQKEQQSSLLNKARNRQSELGNGWEAALLIALRLENTFGRGGLDERVYLSTLWDGLEARDVTAELEQAKLRKDLGMPVRLIAQGLGLTQDEMAEWEAETDARRAVAAQIGAVSAPAAPGQAQGDGGA